MLKAMLLWLVLCLFAIADAKADTIGVHAYTAHWTNKYNNVNSGLYFKADDWVVGAYSNSYNRPSVYAGLVIHSGPFEIVGGVVTGYNGVCPKVCKALTPMFVPSVALPLTSAIKMRLSVPNAQGVHLSLEYKL